MEDPEQLLNHIFLRTGNTWGVITSLRTTMEAGLPTARAAIEASNADFMRRQLSGGQRSIFVDPSKVVADFAHGMVRGMTDITLTQARSSMDAASLVFSHSLLDGAALDYCRVTTIVDPGTWEEILKGRQVPLHEVKARPFSELLQEQIDDYFETLERESLFRKIDLVYKICQPKPKAETIKGYSFDRGRLERLDRLRHDIIHGAAFGQPIAGIDDELDYMLKTANHLMVLVAQRFDLKLSGEYMKSFYLGRSQTQ